MSAKLRRDGFRTDCVAVSVRSNTFQNQSHQQKLANPTDITEELYRTAEELLRELWDGRMPIRLMGVALTGITRDRYEQLSLFDEDRESREKQRKVDAAMDAIRERFGNKSIVRGSTMKDGRGIGKKYEAQMDAQKK